MKNQFEKHFLNKMFEDAINVDAIKKLNKKELEKINKILKDY